MKRKIACMFMALMLVISLVPLGAVHSSAASYLYPSENAINLIKQFEGFSATAYWDVNQWTIGYGTTGSAGQTISQAEADLILRDKVNKINEKINQFAASRNLYLNQYQQDALICFSFNCGTDWTTQGGRFYEAVVKSASVNEFLFAISLWANVGSTPDANLLNRRMSEANLYLNGVYSTTAPAAYTYTIFDPNGGVPGNGGEDKMQGYLSGSNVNILVGDPTKPGATFGGWFTAPTGGTAVKYLSASTSRGTLYAQYGIPASVTSTYANVRNGAGNNFTQIGTLSAGSQIVILETAMVNNQMWGRFADGWVSLEYTNYTSGQIQQQQTSAVTGSTGTVVCSTGVNVRSGAGTNYPVVGSAYNGQRVTVSTVANVGGTNWGCIGTNQWICLNYVRMDSGSVSAGTTGTTGTTSGIIWDNGNSITGATGTTGAYQLGVVTANNLNVRTAAGVSNPSIGKLTKGTQVKVYSQVQKDNAMWGKIDQGWVCMSYISLVAGSTTTTPGTGTTTATGTVIATGTVNSNTALNVRSGAGTAAPRVSTLNPGTPVSIYEKVNVNGMEWGRIGANQWVCLAYVTLTAANNNTTVVIPSTNNQTVVTNGQTGTVISSTGLNVRAGAGSSYARVGSLTPGSVVTILETANDATGLTWGRTSNGWVCMSYIRMNQVVTNQPTVNNNTTSATNPITGKTTTTATLNVRAAAGTNNAIVGKLAPGSTITIYELANVNGVSWGRTASGWVCMNYVTLTSGSAINWY